MTEKAESLSRVPVLCVFVRVCVCRAEQGRGEERKWMIKLYAEEQVCGMVLDSYSVRSHPIYRASRFGAQSEGCRQLMERKEFCVSNQRVSVGLVVDHNYSRAQYWDELRVTYFPPFRGVE
jgi:hypothetical protein